MATLWQLYEVLQIDEDGNRKATSLDEISRGIACGFLAWNASRIIRITNHPALMEHNMGALMIILTFHLKDIISHSQRCDGYSTTHEELVG